MDFVRTTRFDETKGCELWQPKPKRTVYTAADLDREGLTSAPEEEFDRIEENLNRTEQRVGSFQSRIDNFQAVIFAILGIIIAALAFVGVSKFTDLSWKDPSSWQIATWVVMLSAIAMLTVVLVIACVKALWRK